MKKRHRSSKRDQNPTPERPQDCRPKHRRGARFEQLLALARTGDQEAVADLFREFGFRFGEEEA